MARAVGYQPVGIKPRTRDSLRSETSITATLLLSAFATYKRRPSGESASASGVEPTGAFGSSAVEIVSTTLESAMTLTWFEPESATKRRPSLAQIISLGWLPTAIRVISFNEAGSRMLTDLSPQFETARRLPSGENAKP